jgi:hypothetical protein
LLLNFSDADEELIQIGLASRQLARHSRLMIPTKTFKGEMLRSENPSWAPLINLVGNQVEHFMWMFRSRAGGRSSPARLQALVTRRHIHLTLDGRAFVYEHPEGGYDDPSRDYQPIGGG